MNILVIPDSHASPDDKSLDRFKWLGQFIIDRKPEVIIDIGDRADLPSLSTYDKGTKGFEGRRYHKDLASVREANWYIEEPMRRYNEKRAEFKKKQYKPLKIMCLGNHEHRIQRACNTSPELDGLLSYNDLNYEDNGWKVHDFLDIVEVGGILFSHYFVSGVMSRPIGGVNAARQQILKNYKSCVSGHSHLFDYAEDTDPTGKKIQSLVCGVFVEDNPQWNTSQAYSKWSSGLVMLNNVKDGTYDLERVSMDTLRSNYA